jgi:PKD repeat protein
VITVGVGPAVRFTGPRHLHPGRRASFSSAGSHAVNTGARLARVVWGWGDGHVTSTATARAVRHRYSAPGHYHLRLTVRDSTGASRTIKRTITVAW